MKAIFTFSMLAGLFLISSCKKSKSDEQTSSANCRTTTTLFHLVRDNALNMSDVDIKSENFGYDQQGRLVSYNQNNLTAGMERYVVSYTYGSGEITETYKNSVTNAVVVTYTYKLDGQNRIVSRTEQPLRSDEARYTYKYDAQGYMIENYQYSRNGSSISERRLTYTYTNGNLTAINTAFSDGGPVYDNYKTDLTYTDVPQKDNFILNQGYPVLYEQYHPLRKFFGTGSKNMIASVKEFLGYGYANYAYTYEQDGNQNVTGMRLVSDSNNGRTYTLKFGMNCN